MENIQNYETETEIEIDLLELLSVLLHRWKMLLLGLIAGAVLAGGFVYIQAPVYESQAQIFVLSETTSITSLADVQIGSTLSTDFVEIAMSRPIYDTVIEIVEEEYGYTLTREDIQDMVTVEAKTDTRILLFTATNEDPLLAYAVADAMKDVTAEQIAAIMKSDLPTTVEDAEIATEPNSKGLIKYAAVGALIGLVIMALIFIIPYLTNDRINTKEDVERYLEEGVLAVIPIDKNIAEHKKSRKRKSKD
ncbi:MAG: Wzz/FepE/Etk N-terminal domain-containing protein [Oscillospiraceae bacterium]|nr:Wzz/FepE/Etk N-terminal domain-containing protein [Clostridiales bacterium]MCD8145604.1 Wzz/FepE/Etk N-terminal domain-containing protein [Oscillospiraceae bacterium]